MIEHCDYNIIKSTLQLTESTLGLQIESSSNQLNVHLTLQQNSYNLPGFEKRKLFDF
jgi:hypothetical protein